MSSNLSGLEFIIPLNSHSSTDFQAQLASRLEQNNASALIFPQNQEYLGDIEQKVANKSILTDHLNHKPSHDFSHLINKYSINSPRSFIFPQLVYDYEYLKPSGGRFLPDGPTSPNCEKYLTRLHLLLDYLDGLYERGFQGIPIQYQGGEINRRALARVAKYHEIPSVRCSFNPLPGRSTIRNGEEMYFQEVDSALEHDLTKEQEKRAEQYRLTVIRDKPQVGSNSGSSQQTSLVKNILGKLQTVWNEKSDSLPLIYKWSRRTLGKPIQAKAQQFWSLNRNDTDEYIQNTEFVFYPIQYFRESRVTMRSPAFYDQARLIEHLSRSVPHETSLCVKDHPRQCGAMPFFDIRRISRYATLADPSFSAHDIIENAEAVVTLNNTVGHEAIVFGKPVVALGSALYSDLKSVVSPSDINELDMAISEAINKGGLSDDEVRHYIDALFRISEPVVWGDPDYENISNFVSAIEFSLNNTDRNVRHIV
jgi:hypothetical protein